MALNESQLNSSYGRPKTFTPVQVQSRLPWLPRSSKGTVQVVVAHPLVADLFVETCHAAAAVSDWVPKRIDSYNPRPIRNYKTPAGWKLGDKGTSRHAWALAFDFFATPSDQWPTGGVWTPDNPVPAEFAQAFIDRGFTWGHHWNRTDDPHIEYSQIPRATPTQDLDGEMIDFLSAMAKQGDVGADVLDLQFMLRAAGQKVEPTGIFDSGTHGAVVAIQTASVISVDGLVGPQTEAAISTLVFTRHGDAAGIVKGAYLDCIGREPDGPGGAYWLDKIQKGYLVPDLWQYLWDSPEAKGRRARAAAPAPAPMLPDQPPMPPPSPPVVADDPVEPSALATIRACAEDIITAVDAL